MAWRCTRSCCAVSVCTPKPRTGSSPTIAAPTSRRTDEALLDYVRTLTAAPSGYGEADVEALRARGFSDAQILEAIVTTSLAVFLSTLAGGTESEAGLQAPPGPRGRARRGARPRVRRGPRRGARRAGAEGRRRRLRRPPPPPPGPYLPSARRPDGKRRGRRGLLPVDVRQGVSQDQPLRGRRALLDLADTDRDQRRPRAAAPNATRRRPSTLPPGADEEFPSLARRGLGRRSGAALCARGNAPARPAGARAAAAPLPGRGDAAGHRAALDGRGRRDPGAARRDAEDATPAGPAHAAKSLAPHFAAGATGARHA